MIQTRQRLQRIVLYYCMFHIVQQGIYIHFVAYIKENYNENNREN